VLTPAVSGPRPAPGLNQAVHDVWPQDGSPAAVVFSTMHSKCPLVQERSEGGSMSPGRERPNPWQNRTFAQACSLLCGRPCGDQSQRGKRESPREGPYRTNPRGVRAGGRGQRDRSPRKPMGPSKNRPHHLPSQTFSVFPCSARHSRILREANALFPHVTLYE